MNEKTAFNRTAPQNQEGPIKAEGLRDSIKFK